MSKPLAVVWGLGRFGGGIAAAAHLFARGWAIRVMDKTPAAGLATSLARLRELGCSPVDVVPEHPEQLDGASLLVVNPAVPKQHPLLEEAARRDLTRTQELDLFLAAYPGRAVAVTGTNGKSTTTAMVAAALAASAPDDGDAVLLGGNIGHSLLLDEARWRRDQWAVVEVSSFQAVRLRASGPGFAHAVLTPITADHVTWHGGLDAYRRDKLRLLDRVVPGGLVVGHPTCRALASGLVERPQLRPLLAGTSVDGPAPRPDGIWLRGERLLAKGDLRLLGAFNLDNALLALALAEAVGIDPVAAAAGIAAFEGLPHRLRLVGEVEGIAFYDNGVSTVAETTLRAVETLRPARLRWVGGGRAKDPDLSEHARGVAPLCASADLFGEVAPALGSAIASAAPSLAVRVHRTVREALAGAFAAARPGEAVLFSPGFASQDQYANFADRAADALGWWAERGRQPAPPRDAAVGL